MKSIVFDTSAIISLATNNLLWTLKPLKEKFNGSFIISDEVKKEVYDNPIRGKKFKLEAVQIMELINAGVLEVKYEESVKSKAMELANLANNIFKTKGESIRIVHLGEIESLALAIKLKSDALVIDERTTRVIVEDPRSLADFLSKKFHTKIHIDEYNLEVWRKLIIELNVTRSAELMTVAYELGVLDNYLPKKISRDSKETLLDGLLWGVKLRGCAISVIEIEKIKKIVLL